VYVCVLVHFIFDQLSLRRQNRLPKRYEKEKNILQEQREYQKLTINIDFPEQKRMKTIFVTQSWTRSHAHLLWALKKVKLYVQKQDVSLA